MTQDNFLSRSVADIVKMLMDNNVDSLGAKIIEDNGSGFLVEISYKPIEEINDEKI